MQLQDFFSPKLLLLLNFGYNVCVFIMKKKKIDKWYDPVVEETRARGRVLTVRFGNDPKKIMDYLRKIEKKDPDKSKYVSEVKIVKKAS